MSDYKERVIEENAELNKKMAKLKDFFSTDKFCELHNYEIKLLRDQHKAMHAYSVILNARISNWL